MLNMDSKDMIDGINAGIYKGAVLTDLSESYRELGEEKDNLERYDANISQLKALGAIENVPINNKDLESIEGTKKKLDQIEGQYEQKLDELNKEISETVKNLAPGATKPPEIIVKEAEIFDIKKQINDTKKKIGETKEQIVNLGEVRGDHVTYKTKSDYSTREIDKTLNKINNLTKETASWTVRDAMSANTNVETRAILGKEFHDKITYFTGTEKSLGMEEKKGGLTGTIEGDIGVIFATVDGTMGPGADFYVEAIKQIANEERVNIIREAEQWTKDRKTLEGPRPPLGFRTETGEEKAEKRNKAAADLVRLTREHGWTKPSDISKQIADMEKHRVFDESGKFIEDSRKSEEKGLEKSIKAIAGGIDNEGLRKKILDQSEIGARYIESEGRGHDNGSMGGAGEFYKGISGEFLGYKSDSEDSGALLKALVSGGDLPKQPYNHTNKKTGEMVIRYKDSNEIDKKLTAMKIALIRNGVEFKGSEGSIILPNIGESGIKIYKEGNKLMARKLGVRKK